MDRGEYGVTAFTSCPARQERPENAESTRRHGQEQIRPFKGTFSEMYCAEC
jgi:hypothetical protein